MGFIILSHRSDHLPSAADVATDALCNKRHKTHRNTQTLKEMQQRNRSHCPCSRHLRDGYRLLLVHAAAAAAVFGTALAHSFGRVAGGAEGSCQMRERWTLHNSSFNLQRNMHDTFSHHRRHKSHRCVLRSLRLRRASTSTPNGIRGAHRIN